MEMNKLKEAVEFLEKNFTPMSSSIQVVVALARSVLDVAGKLPEPFKYISTHTQPTCDCKYCAKVDGFNMCLDQCILAVAGQKKEVKECNEP
jgi:hypothetical protein